MNSSRITRLAVLAVVAAACAPRAATPPVTDEAAIRTALNAEMVKFAQAIKDKNAAGVANMFTEDGTWILPDASTFTGRTAIEAGATKQFGTFESFVVDQISIDKLCVVSDSEAVTFSHGHYTLTASGNAPLQRVNPVADHWKKGADGVWRVTYELNADGPAPTTVATTP